MPLSVVSRGQGELAVREAIDGAAKALPEGWLTLGDGAGV